MDRRRNQVVKTATPIAILRRIHEPSLPIDSSRRVAQIQNWATATNLLPSLSSHLYCSPLSTKHAPSPTEAVRCAIQQALRDGRSKYRSAGSLGHPRQNTRVWRSWSRSWTTQRWRSESRKDTSAGAGSSLFYSRSTSGVNCRYSTPTRITSHSLRAV